MTTYDALLVVSFGGPEGPDDVVPFLENVTRGRGIPRERLAEVGAHYLEFGGISPINAQCRALIDALRVELTAAGRQLPVYWGNRNWHPMLADTIRTMRDDGVQHALAFVTSAWSSYSACHQYLDDIALARSSVGDGAPQVDKIRQFFDHPGFVEPMAANLRDALRRVGVGVGAAAARVIFTAHSIPSSMASSCDYVAQLGEAARLIAAAARVDEYDLAYQSRSGPPSVPWLEPDIGDHIDELADAGIGTVIVAPLGFISDHMEVVYDLDTQAAARAAARGMRFERVATVGTDARFVAMIRELIDERLDPALPRRALGALGVRPDSCPFDCCPAPSRSR